MAKNEKLMANLKFLATQAGTIDDEPFESVATSQSRLIEKKLTKKRQVDDSEANKIDLERLSKKLQDLRVLDDDDFDCVIGTIDEYDEDEELKSALISEGRKYARDFAASADSSELAKAFAPQETKLKEMLKVVDRDLLDIGSDLDLMRNSRSGRGRLPELISAKTSVISTELSIIKEINNIKKMQFEIKAKNEKAAADNNVGPDSSALLQSIFNMDQGGLFTDGGRDVYSGTNDDEYDTAGDNEPDYEPQSVDNSLSQASVESSSFDDGSDGAKFLKYEKSGVQMVLLEDADGERTVYAEDRDGNRLDDYPLPKDISELTFDINMKAHTAIDQLQRKYRYVYTGSDID